MAVDTPRLPIDSAKRKTIPLATGFLDYFPDAIAEIACISWIGNQKHNPGEPLHWARSKSSDEADAAIRHFLERGGFDTIELPDGSVFKVRHSALAAWRMLAALQKEIEEQNGLPISRGSRP